MWRWVLDTSVLVAGLRSRQGASYILLGLVADRLIRPLATPALFYEYEDVLKRPEHLLAMGITVAEVDRYLNGLADAIQPVEIHYRWRPQLPDPNDELVFEAAINGGATALITHNIRDFSQAGPPFGIETLRPADALKRIRG
jgi:putative PIN family toxin of toxin-antitoxin system